MHPNEPPRISLALLPTPLVEMNNLARHLDVDRIVLKRDDLTGLETTGNKVRKLEYVVADAMNQGADTLVTHGGFQSNHCRATAAIGARLGLRVRLILRSPHQKPPDDGNLFLDRLMGAHITLHSPEEYTQRRKTIIDQAMAAEREAGFRPYFFPVGASTPLGCWGYIRAMHELVEQLGKETRVDVFSAVSSSGTFAGLMLGRALFASDNWRVIGVPVSDSVEFFRKDLRELERRTVAEYQLDLNEDQTPIELIDGFIGEGYAVPYPAALDTVRLLARLEGVLFDPTYTAKAMTGMIATIRAGGVRKGALPVFVHTGGIFGLLARRDLFAS
ncbi:MAG TPA: D-cysteine desulfhydrase family protein [Tepidisphaeraceae bacterium]|jgi:D-cysteine desulfhydrase|nr:D-cysteine desulfhydrase family protein [Tepidisphaeraceae bacterium]